MTKQSEKNLRLTFWGKWKRMITFLIAFVLAMKQLFMCLESLTNITQEFGEVKIHMLQGNFSVTAQRLMCGADFCVTKLLDLQTLTEYVAPQLEEFQSHILFQQDGAPPLDWKRWSHILAPSFNGYNPFGFFIVGLRQRYCLPYQSKGYK